MIERQMFHNPYERRGYTPTPGTRRKPTGRANWERDRINNIVQGDGKKMREATREVAKRFKVIAGEKGEYSVVLEQGAYRETIAVTFGRAKYRARGFSVKTDNLYENTKDVINMHDIVHAMVNLLNNLYSCGLLLEDNYNNVLDALEPFLDEALDFSEVEPYLEETNINANKKKRIKRKERK